MALSLEIQYRCFCKPCAYKTPWKIQSWSYTLHCYMFISKGSGHHLLYEWIDSYRLHACRNFFRKFPLINHCRAQQGSLSRFNNDSFRPLFDKLRSTILESPWLRSFPNKRCGHSFAVTRNVHQDFTNRCLSLWIFMNIRWISPACASKMPQARYNWQHWELTFISENQKVLQHQQICSFFPFNTHARHGGPRVCVVIP